MAAIEFILIAVITGTLSLANPGVLENVAHTRMTKPTLYPIAETVQLADYDCLLGVRYGLGNLIGQSVAVNDEQWLVVDVEADVHQPYMRDNGLLADINCSHYVHRKVKLSYRLESYQLLSIELDK
jgi:hypothetical protein